MSKISNFAVLPNWLFATEAFILPFLLVVAVFVSLGWVFCLVFSFSPEAQLKL